MAKRREVSIPKDDDWTLTNGVWIPVQYRRIEYLEQLETRMTVRGFQPPDKPAKG